MVENYIPELSMSKWEHVLKHLFWMTVEEGILKVKHGNGQYHRRNLGVNEEDIQSSR